MLGAPWLLSVSIWLEDHSEVGTAFADHEKQNTETFVEGTTASEIDFPV